MDIQCHQKSQDTHTIRYCSDFICTYHLHDLEDQDDMYKCQMVQAFMIEDWYDDIVNKTVRNLYNEITSETNPHYLENKAQMERLFQNQENSILSNEKNSNSKQKSKSKIKIDRIVLFQALFGFDYFFKTHKLISNFLNNKKIVSGKLIDEFDKS